MAHSRLVPPPAILSLGTAITGSEGKAAVDRGIKEHEGEGQGYHNRKETDKK